jgi:flagellar biosynthetic protein FlhB
MIREDDGSERTYEPTPLRLDEARRRGQVARSADLAAAVPLLAGVAMLGLLGPRLLSEMTRMTAELLDGRDRPMDGPTSAGAATLWAAAPVLLLLGPVFLGVVVVAILANVVQVGFLATADTIRPDFSRLSPLGGLRRAFSVRSATRLGLTVVKVAIVAGVGYATIREALPQIVAAAGMDVRDLAAEAGACVYRLGLRVGGALVALALVDWLYQRWQHREDLKMTRREWLEDLKRMEGDPAIDSRLRQIGRRLASQGPAEAVPAASALVATGGLVVAVQSDETPRPPRVVAKASGLGAARMRRAAEAAGVPVIEDGPLAVSLDRRCRTGQRVPKALRDRIADAMSAAKAADARDSRLAAREPGTE